MQRYHPHILQMIRKDTTRRSDILKGAALLTTLVAFVVFLFVTSNYGHESYRYSILACTLQDQENCPALALLE